MSEQLSAGKSRILLNKTVCSLPEFCLVELNSPSRLTARSELTGTVTHLQVAARASLPATHVRAHETTKRSTNVAHSITLAIVHVFFVVFFDTTQTLHDFFFFKWQTSNIF